MDKQQALAILKAHEADIRTRGAVSLYLFGSTVRDQASTSSDIDLFFDHEQGTMGLFALMDLQSYLTDLLGIEVDLASRDSLHPVLKEQIIASAEPIF